MSCKSAWLVEKQFTQKPVASATTVFGVMYRALAFTVPEFFKLFEKLLLSLKYFKNSRLVKFLRNEITHH
ncbi:MAG: hypothetical protein ACI9WS_000368 [Paraglaciecola psychrophila]